VNGVRFPYFPGMRPAHGKSAPPRHIEADTQAAVTKMLCLYENRRLLVWAPVPNGQYIAGTPDERAKRISIWQNKGQLRDGASDLLLGIAPFGRMAALELKSPGGRVTPGQRHFLDVVRTVGGFEGVAFSFDEAKALIDGWIAAERQRAKS
jgi:hypothetical protein